MYPILLFPVESTFSLSFIPVIFDIKWCILFPERSVREEEEEEEEEEESGALNSFVKRKSFLCFTTFVVGTSDWFSFQKVL